MEGKICTIYYNDTPNSVSKVVGKVKERDSDFIHITGTVDKFGKTKGIVSIPISKLIRIEEGER